MIAWSSGVQQGDLMGREMYCLALRPGLKRFGEEFKGDGEKAVAYIDDIRSISKPYGGPGQHC